MKEEWAKWVVLDLQTWALAIRIQKVRPRDTDLVTACRQILVQATGGKKEKSRGQRAEDRDLINVYQDRKTKEAREERL